jgi:putative ABC transport system permease protein
VIFVVSVVKKRLRNDPCSKGKNMNYFKLAYRNLGRHRRRSALSALALGLGTALLMFVAAFFEGEMRGSMETTLRLNTGHLQITNADYDPDKLSVAWEYLIENPEESAAQIEALEQVKSATPRLVASGIVSVRDESAGVQIMGIDPASAANDPYRTMVSGEFITADDRTGILIGLPLAQSLNLNVGDSLNLLVNTAEGDVDEQQFTIRGIFTTGTSAYDKGIVFLPLAKAQAFSGAENRASYIFVMLNDREQADAVAAAIQGPNLRIRTWTEMNQLLVLINDFSNAYLTFINLIVLGVTATVIVNTLLMSVFRAHARDRHSLCHWHEGQADHYPVPCRSHTAWRGGNHLWLVDGVGGHGVFCQSRRVLRRPRHQRRDVVGRPHLSHPDH